MAQNGVFGEILRAEGAYIHDLDKYWGAYWHNPNDPDSKKLGWRMAYNMKNRGDLSRYARTRPGCTMLGHSPWRSLRDPHRNGHEVCSR